MVIAVIIAAAVAALIAFGAAARLISSAGGNPKTSEQSQPEKGENAWSPEELAALVGADAAPASDREMRGDAYAAGTEPVLESDAGESASALAGEPAFGDEPSELPILRLTREDVLYYAAKILPARFNLERDAYEEYAEERGIEILRRSKAALPDILLVDGRIFALLVEKRRVLKLYLRAGTERMKELRARWGGKRAGMPGGFYEWIVDSRILSKEKVYREVSDACEYALGIETSDSRTLKALSALFETALETDAFRKDEGFARAMREKREIDVQYDAEHGISLANISRDSLLEYIDKYAEPDESRTELDPDKPNRAVTVLVSGKPYLRLYEHKGRVRVRVNIPYEYSVALLREHPLVYKVGKNGTWYDVVVDDTFHNRLGVMAIAETAKAYTRETTFIDSLKNKQ